MRLTLLRTESVPDGTFGTLTTTNLRLFSVEDDWRNNERRVSCIPAGLYTLRRTIYRKHGYETFEVTGVPDRTRILIHPGNTEEDLEGCIAVGTRRGRLWVNDEDDPAHPLVEKQAVVSSQEAFRQFMNVMSGQDEATLSVEWGPGLPLST